MIKYIYIILLMFFLFSCTTTKLKNQDYARIIKYKTENGFECKPAIDMYTYVDPPGKTTVYSYTIYKEYTGFSTKEINALACKHKSELYKLDVLNSFPFSQYNLTLYAIVDYKKYYNHP